MRKLILMAALAATLTALASGPKGWKLAWMDDFTGEGLDTTVWSMTDRGKADWQNTQSKNPACYEISHSVLHLKGIVNPDLSTDSAKFLTGGIWTKDKKGFKPGKFEIKARLDGAKGAWPAIWLLPFETEKYPWPGGGEIDIMERLNNNHFAYQTVHSHYTYDLGRTANPKHGSTGKIDRDGWNVYGVEMYPDSLVFTINGEKTFTYPKVNGGADGQFPFYIPQYLLVDMQLGGQWVGAVDPADLPAEMQIDWVKYYEPED